MFAASKLLWLVVNPGNLLVVASCAGVIMLWAGWHRTGKIIVSVAALSLLAVAVVPIGGWLTVPLENRFPAVKTLPDQVAGIVVLSGASRIGITEVRGQPSVNEAAERLLSFVYLARHYPDARLVFTGGSNTLAPDQLTAADVARQLFTDIGFDTSRVLFEDKARNTYEHTQNLAKLITPREQELWLLVTSARHMPRAVGVFRLAGWNVMAYPVDYESIGIDLTLGFDLPSGLRLLTQTTKEWVGLAAYYLMGRTSAFFPDAPHSPSPSPS